jgi:hypothetical protein
VFPTSVDDSDKEDSLSNFIVRKAAVLGAGVMGAQIAAHLANAEVPVVLFDLPAREGDPNGIVNKAIDALRKLEPSPLATKDRVAYIDAANYSQHLDQLKDCDLIIEAIAEKMEWKDDLYRQIAPSSRRTRSSLRTPRACRSTASKALPEALRSRFCGIHFFNPPRYMHLVELIATRSTDPALLDNLESWLVSRLGKGIVRALDTPNFVANRVGVFSMLAVMHHTQRLGLGFDVVDALDRTDHRSSEERHLSHRRRGRSGHPGACRQDHAGHPARRSLAWLLQRARLAGRADRQGRARPEDALRHLQKGRAGDQGARPGQPGLSRECRRH